MVLCSMVGAVRFQPSELLTSPIFLNLRLPRVVLSVMTGMVLALCGATYQAVFRNPLTDPYILGVSSGSSLGAAVAIILGLGASRWGIGGCALVAALLTVLLISRLSSVGGRLHPSTLLLSGVCFTFLATAAVSILMVLHQDKMDQIVFWTMGSFSAASWSDVLLLLPILLIGSFVVLFRARHLDLLLLGSEQAQSLGVDVRRLRKGLLLVTSLMVAFAVSLTGVIGFVGLVVPHAVRLLVGPSHRNLLPCSLLAGGLFLLLADTLARTLLPPAELPVGAITALFGAPFFLYLLFRNKPR